MNQTRKAWSPKETGKAFLNHLIFTLKVKVIAGFKAALSVLNYTLLSCGLVSVSYFELCGRGIACFVCLFVLD